MATTICILLTPKLWAMISSIAMFLLVFVVCRLGTRGSTYYFFDAQDYLKYGNPGERLLPVAAATGTFAPHLPNYVGVMKLLITVAAASISFGASQNSNAGIVAAKVVLAFSILYGVIFCGLLQFFYEQYSQNVRSYTPVRYTFVQAFGFSALICFIGGYLVWAFNLG